MPLFSAGTSPSSGTYVTSLVAAVAATRPSHPAVVADRSILTYGQLEAQSSAFARELQRSGVLRKSLIGLVADRSVSHIVGALGILKCGAAYLPLDSGDPERRLRMQVEDSGASLIVTTGRGEPRLASSPLPRVQLAYDASGSAGMEIAPPFLETAATDLAYVIYTSGSTGRPKGVEVTHGNLLNLIGWHRDAFHVTSKDRTSFLSSVAVDAAIWELWPNLAAGATVHVAGTSLTSDPVALRDWLVEERITVCFAPTILAETLMELAWPRNTALRTLLTGGDTLRHFPSPELPFDVVNNYGPTETTVVATSAVLETGRTGLERPPIGKPIENVKIYILDSDMRPVADGEPGEIWIGGSGVAKGYRNQLRLNSCRFAKDPFVGSNEGRMYQTGDRGRRMADGQIIFLGRLDDQIKIRGFRVEPAEIEAALDQHPRVQRSVAVLQNELAAKSRLVAHVVCSSPAPTEGDLRAFLKERLPEQMIPSEFRRLARVPLTRGGKVDRQRLETAEATERLPVNPISAPRNVTETRLISIVCSVLRVNGVGIDDNFFMLGGHSLLATQFIARIRDAFHVEIGLRFLFESPTVAQVAEEIERLIRAKIVEMTEEQAAQFLNRDIPPIAGANR